MADEVLLWPDIRLQGLWPTLAYARTAREFVSEAVLVRRPGRRTRSWSIA